MGGGERPIGAAKGTQSDTEALCHPPPPAPPPPSPLRNRQQVWPNECWDSRLYWRIEVQ